ncbi:MAG: hypothetical protein HN611_13450, partial [Gemmatimonadetes bacterium]|nr:hypothetical protein [Gemmatimonadota bacterium]
MPNMSRKFSAILLLPALLLATCSPAPQMTPPSSDTTLNKHPLDQSEYRRFVLGNGLKVLLVSDPRFNKSAAAVHVGVGSLSNPKDRMGLAHFLEHML